MKYTKKFKLECINIGKSTVSSAAKNFHIPKQTLSRWIRSYKMFGESGLENKKPGAKEKPVNPEIEERVLNLWNQKNRSAYEMSKIIEKRNHLDNPVSKRQIYKIYKKNGLKYIKNK